MALTLALRAALTSLAIVLCIEAACAQSRLAEFAARANPQDFFTKASRFGDPQGDPPILPVYADDSLLGYIYLNSDFTGSVGYSGKPVHMLVGIDTAGVITGFKLVEHKEPIVLVGVPEQRVWSRPQQTDRDENRPDRRRQRSARRSPTSSAEPR